MLEVLLIVHLIIAAAMVGVVLLQKSEGGALGIGGSGGGGGGFLTGRGTANLLTRVTAGLAIAFFATSLLLSILPNLTQSSQQSRFGQPASSGVPQSQQSNGAEQPSTGGGVLDALKSGQGAERVPSIPQSQ